MEELWNQTPKIFFDTNTVSSVSDQLSKIIADMHIS